MSVGSIIKGIIQKLYRILGLKPNSTTAEAPIAEAPIEVKVPQEPQEQPKNSTAKAPRKPRQPKVQRAKNEPK